jgi:hypothetical protein
MISLLKATAVVLLLASLFYVWRFVSRGDRRACLLSGFLWILFGVSNGALHYADNADGAATLGLMIGGLIVGTILTFTAANNRS